MKKLLNTLIIIGYGWLTFVTLYEIAIPPELKVKLGINTTTFLFSAAFTGVLSSALLFIKNNINKANKSNLEQHIQTLDKVISIEHIIIKAKNTAFELKEAQESANKLKELENNKLDENNKLLKRQIELQELELESRLTNPLLDKDIAQKIKVVLDNEKNIL